MGFLDRMSTVVQAKMEKIIGRIVVVVLGNGQIQPHVVLTFNGYGLRPIL